MMFVALCLMFPTVQAQNKALEKAQKKEFQKKMKEYKKGNWKVFGSSRTLEVLLLQHYDKLNALGADIQVRYDEEERSQRRMFSVS